MTPCLLYAVVHISHRYNLSHWQLLTWLVSSSRTGTTHAATQLPGEAPSCNLWAGKELRHLLLWLLPNSSVPRNNLMQQYLFLGCWLASFSQWTQTKTGTINGHRQFSGTNNTKLSMWREPHLSVHRDNPFYRSLPSDFLPLVYVGF